MNLSERSPAVLIPFPEIVPSWGGWQSFIDRLIQHSADQGLLIKRLIIPAWFEYGIVWPGLKAGQLLTRGMGVVWATLCRGVYITIALWIHWLLTRERAICFSADPLLLAFVGWPSHLCMLGVYSEGPSSKEEAMRKGIWQATGRQHFGIRLLMAVERRSCMRAARIVADSPTGLQKMVSILGLPPEKGEVIWLGIDTVQMRKNEEDRQHLRERLGWPKDTIVAIFTGQLYRVKGIDILFEAVRRQPDDRLRLVVLGKGELEAPLRQACLLDPVLGRRIHMAGYQCDVFRFLRGADIFVLPSRQEGTSTSLLEALSIGLCAVGSDVGGIHDVLSAASCGVLVPPENPEALAQILRDLTNAPERRADLGRRGPEFVLQNCRAQDMAARYAAVFRALNSPKAAVLSREWQ
jgi:glycosyltransferase involved in cell wall biosynthesis